MSNQIKVKPNEQEITKMYQEIMNACRRGINDSKGSPSHELGVAVFRKYFGGSNPVLDINEPIVGQKGFTPLAMAAYFKKDVEIKALLELGAKSNLEIQEQKITALHISATQGSPVACKLFLDAGHQVDHQSKLLETPMMRGCQAGHMEVVSLFATKNANIKIKNQDGKDCIEIAKDNLHFNIARFLDYTYLNKSLNDKIEKKSTSKI